GSERRGWHVQTTTIPPRRAGRAGGATNWVYAACGGTRGNAPSRRSTHRGGAPAMVPDAPERLVRRLLCLFVAAVPWFGGGLVLPSRLGLGDRGCRRRRLSPAGYAPIGRLVDKPGPIGQSVTCTMDPRPRKDLGSA